MHRGNALTADIYMLMADFRQACAKMSLYDPPAHPIFI